jgi:hypothetical protein
MCEMLLQCFVTGRHGKHCWSWLCCACRVAHMSRTGTVCAGSWTKPCAVGVAQLPLRAAPSQITIEVPLLISAACLARLGSDHLAEFPAGCTQHAYSVASLSFLPLKPLGHPGFPCCSCVALPKPLLGHSLPAAAAAAGVAQAPC